jgi:RecB family endonuclease NucS
MNPPCFIHETTENDEIVWSVSNKQGELLVITMHEVHHEVSAELGDDPGLQKDGVEAHLQELLATHVETLGEGFELVRREFPTPIGPVDLLCKDKDGYIAVEVKRRGEIDGVEQLTRYLDALNLDPQLTPVRGMFVAQEIKPQALTLAEHRNIRCLSVDYDELRGMTDPQARLF